MFILGLLTHSTKSTRRHALEMMNNLVCLRDAYFHLNDPEMHYGLHNFLLNLINKSQATYELKSLVQPHHLLRILDPRISTIFSGAVKFYSVVYIGHVRITTSNYSHNKCADDSSIVYQAGNGIYFGRVHRIFTVDDEDVLFQIYTLASGTHFSCETEDEEYEYDEIQMGTISSGTTTCIIKAQQIIEKCVIYLQPNGFITFIKFPNLIESS